MKLENQLLQDELCLGDYEKKYIPMNVYNTKSDEDAEFETFLRKAVHEGVNSVFYAKSTAAFMGVDAKNYNPFKELAIKFVSSHEIVHVPMLQNLVLGTDEKNANALNVP